MLQSPTTLKITPDIPKIGGDSPKNIQAVKSMKIGAVSDMEYTEENSPTSYALNPTGIIIVLNAPVINTARQKSRPKSKEKPGDHNFSPRSFLIYSAVRKPDFPSVNSICSRIILSLPF